MTKRIKILFIMFQGSGTNIKNWNETTESKFLDRLKELGSVYTYQDKINNLKIEQKTLNDTILNLDEKVKILHSEISPNIQLKFRILRTWREYRLFRLLLFVSFCFPSLQIFPIIIFDIFFQSDFPITHFIYSSQVNFFCQ